MILVTTSFTYNNNFYLLSGSKSNVTNFYTFDPNSAGAQSQFDKWVNEIEKYSEEMSQNNL